MSTELYADDALLHQEQVPGSDYMEVQEAISDAEGWATSWHGSFDHTKTKLLMIASPCRKSGESGTAVTFKPTNEDSPIEIVTRHRHLGVVISEDLKWYHHVQEVIGKFSRRSGLLRWMAQDLPFEAAGKLYLFYVRPVCEYASPVWHGSLRADQALFWSGYRPVLPGAF